MSPLLRSSIFFMALLWATISYSENVITACGHHDYKPWNWLQNDKIVGLCADIATELYRRIGYKVELRYIGPWKRCQKLIEQGKVDLNICSLKNNLRTNYVHFSNQPIAKNENAVFVRANDTFKFTQLEDLQNKTVGMVRGVSLGDKIDRFLKQNTNLVIIEDYHRLFRMLELKRIDVTIFGRKSGKNYLNLNSNIVDLPHPIFVGDLYISISKKSKFVGTLAEIAHVFLSEDYQNWQNNLFKNFNDVSIKQDKRIE